MSRDSNPYPDPSYASSERKQRHQVTPAIWQAPSDDADIAADISRPMTSDSGVNTTRTAVVSTAFSRGMRLHGEKVKRALYCAYDDDNQETKRREKKIFQDWKESIIEHLKGLEK